MLMSPCYLKLLENPEYYLSLPLIFKEQSKYKSMQEINSGLSFPLAVLGDSDIEIHFLHYKTQELATLSWERRIKRIDWNNLFIKFDCGKDYADETSAKKFINLPFKNKLIIGKENFGFNEIQVLEKYSIDAVVQYKYCNLSFNPILWILQRDIKGNVVERNIRKLIYKN